MRKLFAPMMAVIAMMAVAAPLAAQAPTKIGYIDTRRVFQEAPGAQDARATLEREMQQWQAQMQLMDDSLTTMITEFQQRSTVMTTDARQRREAEIRQKEASFRERAAEIEQTAGRRQQEIMGPIMQRVEDAISQVRQAEGYAVIFDVAHEAIVSADPALDISTRVIERMRATGAAAGRRP
jgi:outer membrane protein